MSRRTQVLKIADRYGGGLLARCLGWWTFHKTVGPPFVEVSREALRRVMFIRPGGMGDLLLLLPAAARLKKALPQVRLTLVGERRNRSVAALTGLFDEVLCYDEAPLAFLRRLRKGGWDAVVDTEQFHYSSAIFGLLSKAPVRIGFKINPSRNELYTHLVDYPMDRHESAAFTKLIEPLCDPGGQTGTEGLLDVERLPQEVPGLDHDAKDLLVVFPYGGSRTKSWPAGRWADILRRLLALGKGPVVLVGGKDSVALSREVLHAVNDSRVISLVGRLSLPETAAVLTRARLYIGCDTGVTHLATSLGARAVVLFGPSDERKWGPGAGAGSSVFTPVPCRPCAIFGYVKRCRTIDCMDRISADHLWKAVAGELDK